VFTLCIFWSTTLNVSHIYPFKLIIFFSCWKSPAYISWSVCWITAVRQASWRLVGYYRILKINSYYIDISTNVKEAKKRLYAEYANLTKPEIDERSRAIREDYKKMRDLYTKKHQLSSDLEHIMDRVNNKVKKDTDDFRYELELENPGCTYEFEKS
jgi:ABC-type transporter lipoprotein component MlaA